MHAERRPLVRRVRRPPRPARVRFRAGDLAGRMRAVFVVSAVLLAAVMVRVVLLQTVQADGLLRVARSQRFTERILHARRGTIYAANGTALAVSVQAPTVVANPQLVLDPPGVSAALASVLDLPPARRDALRVAFEAKSKSFVYVARQVTRSAADAVMALKLPGIDVYDEPSRAHPQGALASSVVGLTDTDGTGISGLELADQAVLAGKDGERTRLHDKDGRTIAGQVTTQPSQPGTDLMLTIDPVLQYLVEDALLSRVDALKARGGTVIVMDTRSGQILALANARRSATGAPAITAGNLAAVEAHDPGSVAKAFSLAAAVDQGVVDPTTMFYVPSTWVFDPGKPYSKTIHDAEKHAPNLSVRQIVTISSNIGTMLIADKIGSQKLNEYHRLFGFGAPTNAGVPNETKGLLKPWDKLRGSEKGTVAYGYGYSVSSLQLIAAMNALANGGTYVAPSLVTATRDANGVTHRQPAPATRRVVSAETASTMAGLLTSVVCSGTAKAAQLPGMSVAGKTGTAYKIQANGTYAADDGKTRSYFSSFVGYFPAGNPQLTILVSIDEPDANSNERFGGTAAAPLFKQVAQIALQRTDVTPVDGDRGCPRGK